MKIRTPGAIARLVASAAIAFAAPASAGDRADRGDARVIVIGKEGDLLEWLIELDAEGIADLRADIADARAAIDEAAAEIERARRDMKDVPGGRTIIRIMFAAAREATAAAYAEALASARSKLDEAERGLATAEVDAKERAETQGAIDALRFDLRGLEASLARLARALEG